MWRIIKPVGRWPGIKPRLALRDKALSSEGFFVPTFSPADALQHEANDFVIVSSCFFKAQTHESPACHPILDVESVQPNESVTDTQ